MELVLPCLNHMSLLTSLDPRAAKLLPNTEQEESQEQAGNQRGAGLAQSSGRARWRVGHMCCSAATKLDS